MAISGVMRPGYIELRVMDLQEAITHYRDRMGLELAGQSDGVAYLRAFDEFDHHSVMLREADRPGLERVGFKVARDDDLNMLKARLETLDVAVEQHPADAAQHIGRRLSFVAPTGHRFDLYAEMALSDEAPLIDNPELWRREPRGMRIQRFDHCAVLGQDIAATARIFVEALDFAVTEELVDPGSGAFIGIFLSCSTKAHDLALLAGPENGRIHHTSFFLDSWHDVGHAADLISRYDISLDIGPTRHGITRGQTVYFFDPSGNRNEVFAGGYSYYPDHPTRRWTADKVGKAIFYYEQAVHERFLAVST